MIEIINDSMLYLDEYIKPNTIDSIVTDPPYELNFMNKGWDNAGVSFNKDTWKKCYEVLKPGGYLLAFGGSRTFHRIACAIEDAGFEIRDCIMWLYGSGFPKSMNLGLAIDKKNGVESKVVGTGKSGSTSKAFNLSDQQREAGTGILAGEYHIKEALNQWNGWGTCLKPAFEPIIVARKPFKGSLVDNVLEYGVGGLNIDACRVEYEKSTNPATNPLYRQQNADKYKQVKGGEVSKGAVSWTSGKNGVNEQGRFPANVILTYDETDFDEVCGGFPYTKSTGGSGEKSIQSASATFQNFSGNKKEQKAGSNLGGLGDEGSAARYFYCAKASKKDRDEGLDEFEEQRKLGYGYKNKIDPTSRTNEGMFKERETQRKNIHPTVKPTSLMQYLIRLVTPKGGTVLDPFMGSGSTGKAVAYENKERDANYSFIGVELNEEYCDIAEARITYATKN